MSSTEFPTPQQLNLNRSFWVFLQSSGAALSTTLRGFRLSKFEFLLNPSFGLWSISKSLLLLWSQKKSFYNILIHFYICIVIWACIRLLIFVVALTRKLVKECLIRALSRGLFSHSTPYNLYRQKIWSSFFRHLASRNLAIKMLRLTLGMSLLQKLQVNFLNQSFVFLFFSSG